MWSTLTHNKHVVQDDAGVWVGTFKYEHVASQVVNVLNKMNTDSSTTTTEDDEQVDKDSNVLVWYTTPTWT